MIQGNGLIYFTLINLEPNNSSHNIHYMRSKLLTEELFDTIFVVIIETMQDLCLRNKVAIRSYIFLKMGH